MKFAWLVLLSLSLVSCSGSKSAQKVTEETPQIELSDADEFMESSAEEPAATTEANAEQLDAPSEIMEEPVVTDAAPTETPAEEPVSVAVEEAPVVAAAAPSSSQGSGTMKQYTVQKNETLMLIAFKIYGDYEKWKHLATHNRDTLKGSNVREGMVLQYEAPAEEFVWNPEGLPYLIRTGDTLGRISKTVYTTEKKWKSIWDNNRPLIKDPNRIFAGFTIYYLENGREVANEL